LISNRLDQARLGVDSFLGAARAGSGTSAMLDIAALLQTAAQR